MTLHITNGDVFADVLKNAGIAGDVLPWRDILHEGPVPSDASPDHFNDVRARFIAGRGWGSYDDVRASFAERDRILAQAGTFDEIALWFDPDLYDQLQLVQVLAQLSRMELQSVSLVATNRPGIHSTDEINNAYAQRTPVSPAQYALARTTWQAITSAEPDGLVALLHSEQTDALPYLRPALHRYLEEFPLDTDGLSRTQRAILHNTAVPSSLAEMFRAVQNSEQHPFLGDTTFASYVEQFAKAGVPLVEPEGTGIFTGYAQAQTPEEFWQQRVRLTAAGKQVLGQQANNIELNGIDRHVGGVHLQHGEPIWYRNAEQQLVRKQG